MQTIDFIILLPIALAGVRGYQKGFILEIVSFLALIIAIIITIKLTTTVMHLMAPMLSSHSKWVPLLSYMVTFIGTYLLVLWAGRLLEGVIKSMHLGTVNKMAGLVLGILKMCFVLSMLFWIYAKAGYRHPGVVNSLTYHALIGLAPWIIKALAMIFPFIKNILHAPDTIFKNANSSVTVSL